MHGVISHPDTTLYDNAEIQLSKTSFKYLGIAIYYWSQSKGSFAEIILILRPCIYLYVPIANKTDLSNLYDKQEDLKFEILNNLLFFIIFIFLPDHFLQINN